MHTVNEIKAEFLRLDKLLGINTSDIEIVFSKRTVKRHGSCQCVRNTDGKWRPVKVMIADFLRSDDAAFWETVRHEYAHAAATIVTGKNCGHNAVWKNICATCVTILAAVILASVFKILIGGKNERKKHKN